MKAGDSDAADRQMARTSSGPVGSTPVPDPTQLTTEQLLRAIDSERDYVNGEIKVLVQRLAGIDEATKLRLMGIDAIPDRIDEKVDHLSSLMEEKFASVAQQFRERDTRSERESRDNKVAVDAAFAAQKEAAAKQDESNQKAIDKSEKATNESIAKLAELFKSTTDALADKIDDIKTRLGMMDATLIGIVQHSAGGREAVTEKRSASGAVYAAVGFGITILLALITIIGVIAANGGTP